MWLYASFHPDTPGSWDSCAARRWLRPLQQGKMCPQALETRPQADLDWAGCQPSHLWGWGSLCPPKAQGLEGERSGSPSSTFFPVSKALQANENAVLRIRAPCPEF